MDAGLKEVSSHHEAVKRHSEEIKAGQEAGFKQMGSDITTLREENQNEREKKNAEFKGMTSHLEEIKAGQESVELGVKALKEIVTTGFSEMTSQYQTIKGDLEGIQSLATSSFEMLQEMHYLDGIENIDSAHAVFFSNCDDIDETIASFKNHHFELQKQYTQHLNPRKIIRFFKMLAEKGDKVPQNARAMFDYVVTVEAKFLQMMCVFHIHKGDLKSLGPQYELLVDHFQQLSHAMCPILKLDATVQGPVKLRHWEFLGMTTFQKMVLDKDHEGVQKALVFIPPAVLNSTIDAAVDPDRRRFRNSTPLSIACLQAHLRMIEILTKAGADVTIPVYIALPEVGEEELHPITSCLMSASGSNRQISAGTLDTIKLLIQCGANVQIPDSVIISLAWASAHPQGTDHKCRGSL